MFPKLLHLRYSDSLALIIVINKSENINSVILQSIPGVKSEISDSTSLGTRPKLIACVADALNLLQRRLQTDGTFPFRIHAWRLGNVQEHWEEVKNADKSLLV